MLVELFLHFYVELVFFDLIEQSLSYDHLFPLVFMYSIATLLEITDSGEVIVPNERVFCFVFVQMSHVGLSDNRNDGNPLWVSSSKRILKGSIEQRNLEIADITITAILSYKPRSHLIALRKIKNSLLLNSGLISNFKEKGVIHLYAPQAPKCATPEW